MATVSTSTSNTEAVIPKDSSSPTSTNCPPPAYTPRRHLDLAALTARAIRSQHGPGNMANVLQQRPLYTTLLEGAVDEHEDSPESSPISLRITTAINISRNNNLVCLTDSPASQANAIAQAVVQAIQQNSSGQCGIPMIDEQGCPRPLKIEVDAGMLVEGTGNVVGSQDIIREVLRQRSGQQMQSLRRQREEADDDELERPSKRRRLSQ
ncbi:hypothetical protein G7046_g10070 [Stylonectria norvegica]|nr:hypothetical protein G7046_g10070 [Stylonectria norvegica]